MSSKILQLVKLNCCYRGFLSYPPRQISLSTQGVSLSLPQAWNGMCHYRSKSYTPEVEREGTKRQYVHRLYSRLKKDGVQESQENFHKPTVSLDVLNTRVKSALHIPRIYNVTFKRRPNQYICEVGMTWPEKRSFISEGHRKMVAREEASLKALQWLLSNNFITEDARPVFKEAATLRNRIQVDLKEHSLTKIDDILKVHSETIFPLLSSSVEDAFKSNDVQMQEKLHPSLGVPFPNSNDLEVRNEVLKSRGIISRNKAAFPIDNHQNEILVCLRNSRVTIVKGETGCGKTTRVPQFILDDAIMEGQGAHCNIVVVQPRRLTTMQTAKFVAGERGEKIGLSVGYSVKMSSKLPSVIGGSITFMTGMKLAIKFSNDPLYGVSHVVLDEVHMRDVGTDLVMTLLKQAMKINEKLKIIIMSATMDTTLFQSYFDCFGRVPVVVVRGRTFPVKMHFLGDLPKTIVHSPEKNSEDDVKIDFSLVQRVVSWISKTKPVGAILIFVSGWSDISLLQKSLSSDANLLVVPVHSMFHDCSPAFECAPRNKRKVILATNIAETSITFPDVVYVIDCGIHKKPYRRKLSRGGWTLSKMSLEWITKANVLQRRGRAGRVQPGESFHLFSEDVFKEMEDYEQPGIMTESLEYLILSIKMVNPSIKSVDLLKEFPSPPSETDVRQAVQTLQAALLLSSHDETPTPLAFAAMRISCSLPSALALIYSAIYRCFDQTLAVVASEETPLVISKSALEERTLKYSNHQSSDHLAKARLISDASRGWIAHPSYKRTQALKAFLHRQVKPRTNLLKNDNFEEMVLAVLMKCFGSLLAATHTNSLHVFVRDKSGVTSFIKSRSVNYKLEDLQSPILMYLSGTLTRSILSVSDTSVVSPLLVLLFLPSALQTNISSESEMKEFKLCGRANVTISIPTRDYQRIQGLRKVMNDIQDYFVRVEFLNQPDENYNHMIEFRNNLLSCLKEILQAR